MDSSDMGSPFVPVNFSTRFVMLPDGFNEVKSSKKEAVKKLTNAAKSIEEEAIQMPDSLRTDERKQLSQALQNQARIQQLKDFKKKLTALILEHTSIGIDYYATQRGYNFKDTLEAEITCINAEIGRLI
jgi:hypothetical protein